MCNVKRGVGMRWECVSGCKMSSEVMGLEEKI